ncbi:unnamed protein product [Psylliodes chrysocephalus]|uniref:Uncharacterized protein n=1 Tax=Psylliodes chrysocephalus TaxID=3402493 RepID=A0A9P0G9B5_9CUCU|nr:unnamed protein product [Psylliodes chrysocephala]
MAENTPELITNKFNGIAGKVKGHAMWQTLANRLNGLGFGEKKTAEWSRKRLLSLMGNIAVEGDRGVIEFGCEIGEEDAQEKHMISEDHAYKSRLVDSPNPLKRKQNHANMSARTLKLLEMACSSKSIKTNKCSIPESGNFINDITDRDVIIEVNHEEICKTTQPLVINDEILYAVPNVDFDFIDIPEISADYSNIEKNDGFGSENGLEDGPSSKERNLDDQIIEENQCAEKPKRQDDPDWETASSSSDEELLEENNNLEQQDNATEIELENKPVNKNRQRRKRRHVDTKNWKQEKKKRETGLKYLGKKKKW